MRQFFHDIQIGRLDSLRTYLEVFGHGSDAGSFGSPDYECSERHPRLRARSKPDYLQIGLENPPGRYHAGRLEGMFNLAISKSETALAHRSLCRSGVITVA